MQVKYPVKRNKVYAGIVLYSKNFEEWNSIRSMLYTIDENGMAHDLLYNSPLYPVSECIPYKVPQNTRFIVIESTNLDELLLFFDYPEYLEYKDLKLIEGTMFTKDFAKKYCEYFGITMRNDSFHLVSGEIPRISTRYFFLLNNLANIPFSEYLKGNVSRTNSFKPTIKEILVRTLKKNQ